jgi:hypothetical protein
MDQSELHNLIASTPWGENGDTPVKIPVRVLAELVNGKPKPADKPSWQTKVWDHVDFSMDTLMLLEKGNLNEFELSFLATLKRQKTPLSVKQQPVWNRTVGQKLKVSTATKAPEPTGEMDPSDVPF